MENTEEIQKIYDQCQKVYGTCTDGSFEMCLSYNGYYQLVNEQKKKKTACDEKECIC